MFLLAIDPGMVKCGVAVVERAVTGGATVVRERAVVPTAGLVTQARLWWVDYQITVVLCGNATGAKPLMKELRAALPETVAFHVVEEAHTSERARTRYWLENPPTGWRRLVPTSVQTPPVPYDDYAAVILAEDWLATHPEPG